MRWKNNGTTITEIPYVYDNRNRLISYNGQTIAYDDFGNPLNWRNLTNLNYKHRRLISCTAGADQLQYAYNGNGMRVSKTVNGVETERYYYQGNNLVGIWRSNGNHMQFVYDQTGVCGTWYNGQLYSFTKNVFGDITGIITGNGTLTAQYKYNAWGGCTVTTAAGTENTTATFIGNLNPFRYRGYFYDQETGFYYLQTRYYDPVVCRFLTPDSTDYLEPTTLGGLNLYAYCYNNPVMHADPSGHFAISTLILCGLALVGMGLTIGGVASDNNVMTAIGLTMVAVPALISGVGALFSGATGLSIIGGVTAGAGAFTGAFAVAEYQEAFTGNNWIIDTTGISEEWYNGLMLATAAIATAGTIATGVLTSIGSSATPNQMMNSFNKHPNRWKTVKELVEPGRGANKGGISTYSNYINKWTGSKLGIHKIVKGGRFIHGPHFHP